MTKAQVLEEIANAYNKLDGIAQDLKNASRAVEDAISFLENIPDNASEIEDDEKEDD